MRTFTDSSGVAWTVFEVAKPAGTADRPTYLPQEYGDGWLCFESETSKRRLTPIPARWRHFSDRELELSLRRARAVNRQRASVEEGPRAG